MSLKSFDPDAFMAAWSDEKYSPLHTNKTLYQCLCESFGIDPKDTYVYRAMAETTLLHMQRAIAAGGQNKMLDWYHDSEGELLTPPHPTPSEITAYTNIFAPTASLPSSLRSYTHNAKPGTLRHLVGTHLLSHLHLPSSSPSSTTTTTTTTPPPALLPKARPTRHHKNPYLSLWTYTCHALQWCGPHLNTAKTRFSHHILPVFYHHFGCVVPSYAALHTLAKLSLPARPSKEAVRPILDIGSGNGYWSYMLRTFDISGLTGGGSVSKNLDVRAVDSMASEYRVYWVSDTVVSDGVRYLKENEGGKGCVLLLVYPQATTDFTGPVMRAFEGDTVVVAGTQCGNGFTGFTDVVVDAWVERHLPAFEMVLKMPLPSFAGKDDALFVFQRK
ncbi:hypothetical protein L13192_07575 [Pyrenophora tritici-repentis]|uniref:Uncharacterized protein n=2 Tax=Pyrenophora tritici-repentis TaxID=45151 RepID=A0A922SXM2_9PLEO|nr:uncharacterized protein PTRG_04856 [Pyrenophora tritici-repentis Pt-1C-BFP]EDU47763.1 conserved hypothetical protein [Pyrenophora tritici-repentis Pt-1C-BFP]KAI1510807.1 hypothetical protein Ptr86124_009928 [Pyrenophora tritici-repentis]KAI1668439.1 hypothetical protein L13192_07575 [Pyrenophora tritici-repentis]KAI1680806.1 hypothetical protein KJE20_09657 [Pyrenophora tritici-repentis]